VVEVDDLNVFCGEVEGIKHVNIVVNEKDLENVKGGESQAEEAIKQLCCTFLNRTKETVKVFIRKTPRYCIRK